MSVFWPIRGIGRNPVEAGTWFGQADFGYNSGIDSALAAGCNTAARRTAERFPQIVDCNREAGAAGTGEVPIQMYNRS